MGAPRKYTNYNSYLLPWADKMSKGENLAHKFLEKPAMYEKLPRLKGKTVLCIGCGLGEECGYIKSLGAKKVVGIDISRKFIEYARKHNPHVEFHVMDMEALDFPKNSFDFVYSSLVMHYVKKWDEILCKVYGLLKKTGVFLFSTHHPIKWAAEVQRASEVDSFLMGYKKYRSGDFQIFGDYFSARKIKDIWFDEFSVVYYHQPLSDIISSILKSGFKIIDFIEPKPLRCIAKKKNNFYKIHNKIPLFMIFELKK